MRRLAMACVLPLAGVAACAQGGAGDQGTVTLDVLAAASLTGSFETVADEFEAEQPGVEVRLSFGSSSALAQQVLEGAPADVLATADLATMRTAEDGGAVTDPTGFATNRIVLVTPADSAAGIEGIDDLDDPGVTFVTCVESAPCGDVAGRLLAENDVRARPVSLETDVKAVLTKVLAGEVDAGLVYATDAEDAADDVRRLPVPGSAEQFTTYALAVTAQADDAETAEQWVAFVTGDRGQKVLAEAGFGPETP